MPTMVHRTDAANLSSIMELGLVGGRPLAEWSDGVQWAYGWYEEPPVFLSTDVSPFVDAARDDRPDDVEIEVDVAGLELVADLASLVDSGARYDPDGYVAWPKGRLPECMEPFADEWGCVEIPSLLDPGSDACRAAIALTGTGAVGFVPPGRLTLAGSAPHTRP